MARMRRRSSGDSYTGSLEPPLGRSQLVNRTSTTAPSRRSPRKKTVTGPVVAESCDGAETQEVQLAPKSPLSSTRPTGKQIRLAPVVRWQDAGKSLILEPSTESVRRPRSPVAIHSPLKKTQKTPSRVVSLVQAPVPLALEDNVEDEAEIEESIWCGSGSSSDGSDDELPSPRKLFMPKGPGIERSNKLPAQHLDLTRALGDLQISQPQSRILSDGELLQGGKEFPTPTPYSDKENTDKAILRFSPPRLYSARKETAARPVTPPPSSPLKGRLQSPSKTRARIPTPPLRPSLDAFWDAEAVNEWNDQYSPRKEWKSPRKLKMLSDNTSSSPTASPRKLQSPTKRTKAEVEAKKDWESRKYQLAEDFFADLDRTITDGEIGRLASSTNGVKFIWSKTLNQTAGRANWKRETTKTRQLDGSTTTTQKHHASIELAEKVIDDEHRLLNVIAHEFCHLCNFMISGIKDQPHGRQFKDWGRQCTKAFAHRDIEVTTKHSYKIDYKYIWQCSNEDCEAEFKRHSKSIDTARHTCGSCRSRLVQIKPVPRKDAGAATGYAAFVKAHFAMVKKGMPGASQKEVMQAVGEKYRAEKAAGKAPLGGALSSSELDVEVVDGKDSVGPPANKQAEVDKVARMLDFIVIDDD